MFVFWKLLNISRKRSALFLRGLVVSYSDDPDTQRREFILNILLLGSIFLSGFAMFIAVERFIRFGRGYQGLSPILVTAICILFCFLYTLSRKGYARFSSYFLIALYILPTTYAINIWSIYLPQPLLIYAFIIVMSGVLVGTGFSLFITCSLSGLLLLLGFLQSQGIVLVNMSWMKTARPIFGDVIVFVLTFVVIHVVSWLSNREIYRSLKRAWISEAELKKERDHLEQTVEERTRELKQAQLEKMFQMYRFVEFGRLASGFFHDMTVPLTTVSLNLDAIKSVHSSTEVDQAIVGAKKMGAYVRAIRKQLQKQTVMMKFSLDREVSEVLSIMAAKAREERVLFIFEKEKITMYGNPLKFSQLLTNLISNAIDSYDQVRGKNTRTIHIVLQKKKGTVHISVKDHGKGIPLQLQPKIFEPFVTTKLEKGMGLGLSFCKTIVTKEYHGTISFVSTEGEGTTFTIEIPMVKRKN